MLPLHQWRRGNLKRSCASAAHVDSENAGPRGVLEGCGGALGGGAPLVASSSRSSLERKERGPAEFGRRSVAEETRDGVKRGSRGEAAESLGKSPRGSGRVKAGEGEPG